MQGSDFIVLAIVGAATFFAGFQTGRLSASRDRTSGRTGDGPTPISMPDLPDTGDAPALPPTQSRPRTSAPPPAAAGLMDKGSPGKDRGS